MTALAAAQLLLFAAAASAGEWNFVGARYQGMGGAGVATTNDSFASYWNPAALATAESFDGVLHADALASLEGDALATIDNIEGMVDDLEQVIEDLEDTGVAPGPADEAKLRALIDELEKLGEDGIGLVGSTAIGLSLRWQRYAVFSRLDGQFAIDPVYDDQRIETDNRGANSIVNNQSGATIRGLGVVETGVGYGHSFTVPFADKVGLESLGTVSVGGNLKYMRGITYSKYVGYRTIEDAELDFEDSDLREESDNFGLDLGFLYQPIKIVQVGLVARNVNSPKFDTGDDPADPDRRKNFQLDAQVRAGVAVFPFASDMLVIASDLDLTKNESELLDGFDSRIWSLGAEFKLPIPVVSLALRGGGYMNAASGADHSFVLTGGLGLKVWLIHFDIAGGASPNTVEVKDGGDDFPSRVNFSAQLGIRGNF
ncbi:MAG: conjugal transfer protein TraF [bacterium]|nr:conjugal transfer protein TraF [bacterium]